jgi:hypothetical protein
MGQVGAKLRSVDLGGGRGGLAHWCPACKQMHAINLRGPSPIWSFDGNLGAPTFGPSIHIFTPAQGEHVDPDGELWPAEPQKTICHYFIRAGRIEFCGDSAHALAGQTAPLPDLPDWSRDDYTPARVRIGGVDMFV